MINAVVWVGAGIALVLVLLRLYTRIIIVRKLGMDDHIMVLATVSQDPFYPHRYQCSD